MCVWTRCGWVSAELHNLAETRNSGIKEDCQLTEALWLEITKSPN